jgi:23S rRNA pseudouridine1911/1915/1917 synthase
LQPLEVIVSAQEKGERLDRFVSRKAGVTRMTAQRLISSGAVKVDGRQLHKNHLLRPGENVEITPLEPEEPGPSPQNIPLSIVYQDADLVVVNKPPGLVVHPGAGHGSGTLVNALLYAVDDLSGIGGVLRPGIVHRLDRDTSGLLVVAIGRDVKDRKRMAVTAVAARAAVTNFEVDRDFGDCALLKVELVTGRTHQIRVHLAHIGHPVAGDREYGLRGKLERTLELNRQFLHAYKLTFPHPAHGEVLDFEVPLPEDLENALSRLDPTGT